MLSPVPIAKDKIITLVEFIRNFLMKVNLAKGNIRYFFTDNVDVSSNAFNFQKYGIFLHFYVGWLVDDDPNVEKSSWDRRNSGIFLSIPRTAIIIRLFVIIAFPSRCHPMALTVWRHASRLLSTRNLLSFYLLCACNFHFFSIASLHAAILIICTCLVFVTGKPRGIFSMSKSKHFR